MATFHKLELLRRAAQRDGALATLRLAWRLGRDQALGQHRLLFGMTGEKAATLPPGADESLRVRRFHSWAEVDKKTRSAFEAAARFVWWNPEKLMSEGAELWTGETEEGVLSIAQTRAGPAMGAYFFPMSDTCALVSHCVTLPEARGRGFYVRMLRETSRGLAADGVRRIYIDCTDSNFASERGIRAAGFLPIGRGVHRRSGKLIWHQESPPSVSRLEELGTAS